MENYGLTQQETNGNVIKIPHYYQKNEANVLENYYTMGEYKGNIPTVNSLASSYDRNEKLKEVLGNSLL